MEDGKKWRISGLDPPPLAAPITLTPRCCIYVGNNLTFYYLMHPLGSPSAAVVDADAVQNSILIRNGNIRYLKKIQCYWLFALLYILNKTIKLHSFHFAGLRKFCWCNVIIRKRSNRYRQLWSVICDGKCIHVQGVRWKTQIRLMWAPDDSLCSTKRLTDKRFIEILCKS